MSEPDNADRAAWARAAVLKFRSVCRGSPFGTAAGWDEAIGDLVCDVLHLAAQKGLDPLDIVRRSVCSYLDERDYPQSDGWAPGDALAHCKIITWRGPCS